MQLSLVPPDTSTVISLDPRFRLERQFDPGFVAQLALREKQVQQSYRPIIGIHKWFARRPGSVFRSLILAEFETGDLAETYWQSHNLHGVIADPFMGGGTSIYESLRVGLSAIGADINPMAYWLVRQGVERLDLHEFEKAAAEVWDRLNERIGKLYETTCSSCERNAVVKYFLWVKTCSCPKCGHDVDLFPGYRVAEPVRHPNEVYYCPSCDTLRELPAGSSDCVDCRRPLKPGNTSRGKTACLKCSHTFPILPELDSPPRHRLFAIEYQCKNCYSGLKGRQFKSPDSHDFRRFEIARQMLSEAELAIPDEAVPTGDETDRLHRWGYKRYRDLFNDRQLLGLGILLDELKRVSNQRVRHALATVFSDFLRYQNMLCRYDTYALKCQDIFSVHGFPVGLVACENNIAGTPKVGSGSFVHFVEKYAKAKRYAQAPYETEYAGRSGKKIIPTDGETIEADLLEEQAQPHHKAAWLLCAPSQTLSLRENSLDGVFTDPPYYDNVQYAELMDFCYVWLRKLIGIDVPEFSLETTRTASELTGNATLNRGLEHFTSGLSDVFHACASALKPGAPFVFTYHHNDPMAYLPLVVAILDAGLTCTRVLPVPAEMAASLHIAGTNSSIVDSVFVCRHVEVVRASDAYEGASRYEVATLVDDDVRHLKLGGYRATAGDIACLTAGHIAAYAVRLLNDEGWDSGQPLKDRMDRARAHIIPTTKAFGKTTSV
jgi:adenine-specific DNA methylase